jgi:hypothetical protein
MNRVGKRELGIPAGKSAWGAEQTSENVWTHVLNSAAEEGSMQ